MADNNVKVEGPAGEEGEVSFVETAQGVAAETAGDSVDQMNHVGPNKENGSYFVQDEQNDKRTAEDGGRDDMFVDCPDEIENSESQQNSEEKDSLHGNQDNEPDSGVKIPQLIAEIEHLRDMHEKSETERERITREYKEERQAVMSELAHLCVQLKVSNEPQTMLGESHGDIQTKMVTQDPSTLDSGDSLREMLNEYSRFLKTASDERFQNEAKIKELHLVLHTKDQEIDSLNLKLADISQAENEVQLQRDRDIGEFLNRTLDSLSMVHHHEGLDGSITEKIASIETSVAFLVEKYNDFGSASDQLRRCLNEVGVDLSRIDEIGTCAVACNKILESRRNEENLYTNISNIEIERRKMAEELEKQRALFENLNGEIRRLNAEVEHEKYRCASTKEKLSMAVTKGKALVQQRDSLKQLLAEKTTELAKCSLELQEKSSALEAAKQTQELLEASENTAASLQESIIEKEIILQKCREILSLSITSVDLLPTDITEQLRWLADENKSLKSISMLYYKLIGALSSLDFPESVASGEEDMRIHWLVESFYLYKDEAMRLHSEIAKTKEVANSEIGHLTVSFVALYLGTYCSEKDLEELRNECDENKRLNHELVEAREALENEINHLNVSLSAESQEKSHLHLELESLREKYLGAIEKERLQHDLVESRATLDDEINQLKASISAESDEKSCLQLELQNLRQKHEEVVQKEQLVSLEKDELLNLLLEASGLANDGREEVHLEHPGVKTIFDNCLAKIKESFTHSEPSQDIETFKYFQGLLYMGYQEMSLYKLIVEEDILEREKVNHLSDELQKRTRELDALMNEKAVMLENLNHLEDRCAVLKDKLSMAVKKGKGLFQERENLKNVLTEKNTEIEGLKSELHQSKSLLTESQAQISKLSLEVERIPLLEKELLATKEHADQREEFLLETKSTLQRVLESIESINTPTNLFLEEPVEKVRWIVKFLNEHESSKLEAEQELRKVTDEASSLSAKLSSAQTMIKSLEDGILVAEDNLSQLLNGKRELEISKALLKEELQEEKKKAIFHAGRFEEVSLSTSALKDALSQAEDNISELINERDAAVGSRTLTEEKVQKLEEEFSGLITKLADAEKTIKSLEDAILVAEDNLSQLLNDKRELEISKALLKEELQEEKKKAIFHAGRFEEVSLSTSALKDALSQAEGNISELINERDAAVGSRTLTEEKVQKLEEEFSGLITKLADAEKTIESLEDTLSQANKNVTLLAEQNSQIEIVRADLDIERKKLREEASSHVTKVSDASETIKSLKAAVLNAEDSIAELVQVKKNNEEEILTLSSKLESCMQELAGTRGSMENNYVERSAALSSLQSLLEDETLPSLMGQFFERNFGSLKNIDSQLEDIGECFLEMDSDAQSSFIMEDNSPISTSSPSISWNMDIRDDEVNVVDGGSIEKVNERFHRKSKIIVDKFGNLSTQMDESFVALLRRLQLTKDRIRSVVNYTNSLKQHTEDMETDKQRQQDAMASLESENRILLSTCEDATRRLEININQSVSELRSISETIEIEGLTQRLGTVGDEIPVGLAVDHAKTAKKLLIAIKCNQDTNQLLQSSLHNLVGMTGDLQKVVKESQLTLREVSKERDLYKDKILKLEADLEKKQNLYSEKTTEADDYKEKVNELRKRETELSTSLSKFQEMDNPLLRPSQLKTILNKMNGVRIPDESAFTAEDAQGSVDIRKLCYIIDSFNDSLHRVSSLSLENKELQSIIDQQILEIGSLRKQVESRTENGIYSEEMNKLSEIESGLLTLVRKVGGKDLMNDGKLDGPMRLVPLLDQLVTAITLESENLKSANEELGAKLLWSNKAMNDLSNKVKLLENSNQAKAVPLERDQERGILVASLSPQSEISELQDMVGLGKVNSIPQVPSAAHSRTLRKGSSDHLALNIDSDMEQLIIDKDSDEDKGHVFKSLNTSGLIPRQGRAVADRVDGIWVSGSRVLMNHPRGRLGLIAYMFVVHLWLLGTIL